jgi:hypothetical protein
VTLRIPHAGFVLSLDIVPTERRADLAQAFRRGVGYLHPGRDSAGRRRSPRIRHRIRTGAEIRTVLRFKQQIVACGGGEAYRPLDVSVLISNDLVSLRGPWTSQPVVAIALSARRLSRDLAGYSLDFPGDALDRNLVGGRAGVDEDEIDEGQHEAMAEMQKAAEELGANAIVGVSLDVEGVDSNGSMLLVTVSGTAVVVASG